MKGPRFFPLCSPPGKRSCIGGRARLISASGHRSPEGRCPSLSLSLGYLSTRWRYVAICPATPPYAKCCSGPDGLSFGRMSIKTCHSNTWSPSYAPSARWAARRWSQPVIALPNLGGRLPKLPGLDVSPVSLPGGGSKFDLALELVEDDRGLLGALEYRSDFFEHSTVQRLAGQFRRLLEGAAADPDRRISRFPLLSRQERQQVLVDWNGGKSKSEVPVFPLHEQFAQRVREASGRVALVFGDPRMTYGELDAKSERLASELLAPGIGHGRRRYAPKKN